MKSFLCSSVLPLVVLTVPFQNPSRVTERFFLDGTTIPMSYPYFDIFLDATLICIPSELSTYDINHINGNAIYE